MLHQHISTAEKVSYLFGNRSYWELLVCEAEEKEALRWLAALERGKVST